MTKSYIAVVEQAIELLEHMPLDDYQQVMGPHFTSCIGAHVRHVVDHFLALKNAKHDSSPHRHVDYNVRHRHGKVEQQPQSACQAMQDIVNWLDDVTPAQLSQPLSVTSEIDIAQSRSVKCASTLERELMFVTSHAIHHYALIRIIRSMQGHVLPTSFGVAPATLSHIEASA